MLSWFCPYRIEQLKNLYANYFVTEFESYRSSIILSYCKSTSQYFICSITLLLCLSISFFVTATNGQKTD